MAMTHAGLRRGCVQDVRDWQEACRRCPQEDCHGTEGN